MDQLLKVFFYLLPGTIFVVSQVSDAVNASSSTKPVIFIFGDSTVDVGTNSFVPKARSKANFPPNGIDFPGSKPTGRYSNGFNNADYLSKLMGQKRSPQPYLYLLKEGTRKRKFRGANFASGASGLLDATGKLLNIVPMNEQIRQFKTIRKDLTFVKGRRATKRIIAKSIFIVSVGANDIFGYVGNQRKVALDPTVYIDSLMTTYKGQIESLYKLGARKFAIIDVPPIGCCASQRIQNSTGGCLEIENILARAFNSELDTMLKKLTRKLSEMKYSLGNSYGVTMNIIENPQLFNITYVDRACCGEGWLNGEKECTLKANLCSNRREYLLWDWFHLTEYVSEIIAISLYNGDPELATPINFAQLAAY